MVNFDKLQLLSMEKEGISHRKQFKRVIKIFVNTLIDMYPLRDLILSSIVDRVCLLAQSKVRLIRFGFAYIGLALQKVLLNQFSDL
jgi:hypothetical protein